MLLRYILPFFILIFNPSANAISNDNWATISDVGVYTLLGTSLVVPVMHDDWEGLKQAGYSIGVASGIAFLGKLAIDEERPDKSDSNSFPSGHTTRAFASATTLYRRYGWKVGMPAYLLATLTGSARVAANKHYWHDVLVGAGIGIVSGRMFTSAFNDKVQLVPWIDSDGAGIFIAMRW